MTKKSENLKLPAVALRGMVLFPQMVLHFDVSRTKSILAVKEAIAGNRLIFLSAQVIIYDEFPHDENINKIGVVAEVKQIVKNRDTLRVIVEGRYRAKMKKLSEFEPYLEAELAPLPIKSTTEVSEHMSEALCRSIKGILEQYSMLTPAVSEDLLLGAAAINDPATLVNYIAGNTPIPWEIKQRILSEADAYSQLKLLLQTLEREAEILALEHHIHEQVRGQLETNQRNHYLREQMKVISSELGEAESVHDEISELHDLIDAMVSDREAVEKLHSEVVKLSRIPENSPESALLRTYIETCIDLPWFEHTKDKLDIKKAAAKLDRDHYGMDKVKERILEMFAVRALNPAIKGQILCLVGPPGVGKTSIAQSIAKAMGRKFVRVSLGGVRDESDIRGHRKTYVGSMPGRIIAALQQVHSHNPVMLLDEIDKISRAYNGDPSSALLEVLDPEQNHAFRDHYIELPFDLSQVLFIATANRTDSIDPPLLDRMEIINLPSYTREEKFHIAKHHLAPKQLKRHGLTAKNTKIKDSGIYSLVDFYTRESGVRALERNIASLYRKAAKTIVAGDAGSVLFDGDNIQNFLGAHIFKADPLEKTNEIGLVNGLAWTSVGGEMLQIEAAILPGSGKIQLTGNLGTVMQESAYAAVSYIRSSAARYNIDPDFYKTCDIHIHVPEGAVPKDGPSAGVTICTALISALSKIPVRHDIAMTGEISLRGRVLPIGGLREKSMAAHRAGITTILIPEDNFRDLDDIDKTVKSAINFITARHIQTVLDFALLTPTIPKQRAKKPKSSLNIPEIIEYEPVIPAISH